MKRIISLLVLACPILASAAPDNDKATVQAIIAKYYNRPLAAHKCQLTYAPVALLMPLCTGMAGAVCVAKKMGFK